MVLQFQISAAGLSDQGLVRENNEDAYFLAPAQDFFLVADGMGGHAGGEVASRTIVEVASTNAAGLSRAEDPPVELLAMLQKADAAVREKSVGSLQGMGSTVVALFLRGNQYWVAHAGDSRAYRLHAGRLQRLTDDHTPEFAMGRQSPSYRSGMITRAVGIGPTTEYDLRTGVAVDGDRFLLCSDGLTDAVTDQTIAALIREVPHPRTATERLVAAANAAGGPDNITVVVVELNAGR